MNKPNDILNIVQLSFDWRNIATNNPQELLQKLKRDRLQPDKNNITIIAWSTSFYFKKISDRVSVIHLWAPLKGFRPLYDLLSIFMVPLVLLKHSIRPNIFLIYEFPLVYVGWVIKVLFGSKLVLTLTNLPTKLSLT